MLQKASSRGLLVPLAACLLVAVAQLECPRWQGAFRDCTCGVEYRDQEVRCCSPQTCLAPVLTSLTRNCPFVCQNGGIPNDKRTECSCQPGFFGSCCEQETELCGGTHFAPSGVLSSPGYPDHYTNSQHCMWKISTDPIRKIALGNAGSLFEVERGTTRRSCNHDWVAVYDGASHTSRLIGRFCGNMMPTVRSSGQHMLVEFSSDWQQRRLGFQLHYLTFFAVEQCGRTLYSRRTGVILSPHYPLAYPPNLSCTYQITVRAGNMLILSTEELNVPARDNCRVGDKIIVRHMRAGQLEPLFVLCGTRLFKPIYITNTSLVTLDFSSDCHCSMAASEGRFKLRFEQIPDFT